MEHPHRDQPSCSFERRWLSHHGPEHAERCRSVGGIAVCRRCSVLYPVAVVVAVVVVALDPPSTWLVALMWLAPVPMALDWAAEHLGRVAYSPRRQTAVTLLGAPALGAALAMHARSPFTAPAVAPILWWTLCCLAVAWWGWWRTVPDEAPGWEERHLADEQVRRERLEQLLGDPSGRGSVGHHR